MDKISLMYHCVYEDDITKSGFQDQGLYKILSSNFEEQVRLLTNNNIPVTFTFDDGGVSFYDDIAPILERYHHKGIFFISTKYIGTKGFLTKEQIVDLNMRGHIIGSHSHSHPKDLSRLSKIEIWNEWKKSIDILYGITNNPVTYASVPNGYNSNNVVETAFACGIKFLYTSVPTSKVKIYKGMNCIGRFAIQEGMSGQYVLAIVNKRCVRMKMQFKWNILKLAKYVLGNYYSEIKQILLKIE